MEEVSDEVRKLLDEYVPRMGWAYHPDMKKDVLVERGTGCVIDWTNGEYTPRSPKIHRVRERKINGTIYRWDSGILEGVVQHMYLDPKNNVTIGIGHKLDNVDEAKRFKYYHKDTQEFIEKEDVWLVEKDFKRVLKEKGKNTTREKFKNMTSLRITIDAIEKRFEADVDDFIDQLTYHFPDFDTYPKMAQLGMLDLLFNMGHVGFIGTKADPKFPVFKGALKYRNWIGVAEESHREVEDEKGEIMGGMVDRNAIIRGWFIQASDDDPFFVNPKCPKKNMKNLLGIPDIS